MSAIRAELETVLDSLPDQQLADILDLLRHRGIKAARNAENLGKLHAGLKTKLLPHHDADDAEWLAATGATFFSESW